MAENRENYGQDAPGVQQSLALIGGVMLLIAVATNHFGFFPDALPFLDPIKPTLMFTGIAMIAMSVWMIASSRWGKMRVRDRLLGMRTWRGDEATLDVGCGAGLVAIALAKRTPQGHVHGIDLWSGRDLSENSAAAIEGNARIAGVADRLTVDTGDMRALPYDDAAFDVVASMTAIHNIEVKEGRITAVAEIWRVTKPGGQILIYDIRHARSYARQLQALGAVDVTTSGPILLWGVLGWRFSATKPNAG